MSELCERAYLAYRALVADTPGFIDYFLESTPIREISELRTASHPARRSLEGDIESLRAIPWVFSWTQCRVNLPGWYGVGSALAPAIATSRHGLGQLRDMYRGWPFFRSLIDNAQISTAIADMRMAGLYAGLVGDPGLRARVFDRLRAEYRDTTESLLAVTQQRGILDNVPVLRESIKLRNPYVDPLHAIQVRLLRELRSAVDGGHEEDVELLRYAVEHTINGIAAGLQSTG
jgi:phosphoenolpyruvate carboxylase